jgi:hypothetical protein
MIVTMYGMESKICGGIETPSPDNQCRSKCVDGIPRTEDHGGKSNEALAGAGVDAEATSSAE